MPSSIALGGPTIMRHWRTWFREEEANLRQLIASDPFEGWARNSLREATAERYVLTGAEILLAGGDSALADAFLRSGRDVAIRALAERSIGHGVLAYAILLRALSHSRLLLGEGDQAEAEDLLVSADTFLDATTSSCWGKDWTDQREAYVLAAFREGLLLGDVSRSTTASGRRRRYLFHQDQATVMRGLLGSLQARSIPGPHLRALFDSLLHRIAAPRPQSSVFCEPRVLRLELLVIRWKYWLAGSTETWRDAISA